MVVVERILFQNLQCPGIALGDFLSPLPSLVYLALSEESISGPFPNRWVLLDLLFLSEKAENAPNTLLITIPPGILFSLDNIEKINLLSHWACP